MLHRSLFLAEASLPGSGRFFGRWARGGGRLSGAVGRALEPLQLSAIGAALVQRLRPQTHNAPFAPAGGKSRLAPWVARFTLRSKMIDDFKLLRSAR